MTFQTFEFETDSVRCLTIDGEPWMIATDICRNLGLSNSRDAISDLPDDERREIDLRNTVANSDGIARGNPRATAINEPGLYRLIFKSRKPEAERFKKWVFHEVLPAIRATGSYQPKPTFEARPLDETILMIPASKYIEMLEFKISVFEEKARPKPKRTARPPLSEEERLEIRRLSNEGKSGQEIANTTGRSPASISMVLKAHAIAAIATKGGGA